MNRTDLFADVVAEFFNNSAQLTDTVLQRRLQRVIDRINRVLRVREMTGRATATIGDTNGDDNPDSAAYSPLPTDFGGVQVFELTVSGQDEPVVLQYAEPLELARKAQEDDARGQPTHFTVVDGEFRFWPVPDAEYGVELTYFKRVANIDATAPTNWFSEQHGDVLFHGLCWHAAVYLREGDAATLHEKAFVSGVEEIVADDLRQKRLAAKAGRFTTLGADQALLPIPAYEGSTDA